MMGLGIPEIVIIGAVAMLLFGPVIVRKFFKSAAETAKELKKLKTEFMEDHDAEKKVIPKGHGAGGRGPRGDQGR